MVLIDIVRFDTDHQRTINFVRLQQIHKSVQTFTRRSHNREHRFIIDPKHRTEHFVPYRYSKRALSAELHHPFLNRSPGKRGTNFSYQP